MQLQGHIPSLHTIAAVMLAEHTWPSNGSLQLRFMKHEHTL